MNTEPEVRFDRCRARVSNSNYRKKRTGETTHQCRLKHYALGWCKNHFPDRLARAALDQERVKRTKLEKALEKALSICGYTVLKGNQ